uniref:Uncharacterized protein n=1 Tax=Oryzias sinensis TaxID=183150 RepID=A0A8C7XFB7_9TELE
MKTGPSESSPLTFQIGSTSYRRSLKPGDVSAQVTTDFRPRLSRCFDLLSCGSSSRGFGLGRVMQIDQFLSVQLCRSKGPTEDLFWMNSGTATRNNRLKARPAPEPKPQVSGTAESQTAAGPGRGR